MKHILSRGLFTVFLSMVFVVATANMSMAQTLNGCDPLVREAQTTTAATRAVVAGPAISEETIRQPNSVLATTCFDQSSRVSANEGGQIFSGDFTGPMNQVVNDPLSHLLSTGFLDSIGKSANWSGVVTSAISNLLSGVFPGLFAASSFDCTVSQDLWDDVIVTGINGNVQFLTFDEIVAASFAGNTSTNFLANLVAESGGVIGQADAARAALPVYVHPSFVGTQTLIEVLTAAGY